jgi:hypothetical protein
MKNQAKIITKIGQHLKNKAIFYLLLLIIVALGYLFIWPYLSIQFAPVTDIIYLIPADETKLEGLVTPNKLAKQYNTLPIGVTSDWETINQLALAGKTYGVIIHHAAVDQINLRELQYLFKRKGFVVAGIGIPGDELANLVGVSSMYNEQMGRYLIPTYYFIYSYHIEGPSEQIATREAGNVWESVGDNVRLTAVRSSDPLTNEKELQGMLIAIEENVKRIQCNN